MENTRVKWTFQGGVKLCTNVNKYWLRETITYGEQEFTGILLRHTLGESGIERHCVVIKDMTQLSMRDGYQTLDTDIV